MTPDEARAHLDYLRRIAAEAVDPGERCHWFATCGNVATTTFGKAKVCSECRQVCIEMMNDGERVVY